VNASIRRNLFIIGAGLVVLGAVMTYTDFEIPRSALGVFGDISDYVLVVRTLGVAAGIVCLVIAFVDLLRSRSKNKSE
jgi:hypothetical protein